MGLLGLWSDEHRREKMKTLAATTLRVLAAKAHSAHFPFNFSKKQKRKKRVVLLFVYLRFLSTNAAAMTAMVMTTAAPAMSKVSVDKPVPGSTTTEGDAVGTPV
jgi:hypothetical protein